MNHLVPIPVIAAKLKLKNYKLWRKYKNSYLNSQENNPKKAEIDRDLTLKGREFCWVKFIFIRLFVRGHSKVTRHQVTRTPARSHGLTGLKSQMMRFESTEKLQSERRMQ